MSAARKLLARAAAAVRARVARKHVDLIVWQVNADNPSRDRPMDEFPRELQAIAALGADLILMVETVRYRMPKLPGMRFLGDRDSGPSRQNVSAYVADRWPVKRLHFDDMTAQWPRVQGDGWHEPRSNMDFMLDRLLVAVGHGPQEPRPSMPRATQAALNRAREQWFRRTVRLLAPWTRSGWKARRWVHRQALRNRPALGGFDPNGLGLAIARATGMRMVGKKASALLTRNVRVVSDEEVSDLGGVEFAGDHRSVRRTVIRVPARYLRPLTAGDRLRLQEIPS